MIRIKYQVLQDHTGASGAIFGFSDGMDEIAAQFSFPFNDELELTGITVISGTPL
jgi:hypothetical protein